MTTIGIILYGTGATIGLGLIVLAFYIISEFSTEGISESRRISGRRLGVILMLIGAILLCIFTPLYTKENAKINVEIEEMRISANER